jgi:hypothetical protein
MGVRRNRTETPTEVVNGWRLSRRPNSFAEAYLWELVAVDAEGYATRVRGFSARRRAVAYAENHEAPKTRDPNTAFRAVVYPHGTERTLT